VAGGLDFDRGEVIKLITDDTRACTRMAPSAMSPVPRRDGPDTELAADMGDRRELGLVIRHESIGSEGHERILAITIPNQLGVDYNAHLLETIVKDVAPALGWR
jgi:hypothetical protein